jgi:hypothetical protein
MTAPLEASELTRPLITLTLPTLILDDSVLTDKLCAAYAAELVNAAWAADNAAYAEVSAALRALTAAAVARRSLEPF